MSFVHNVAIDASVKLAEKRGTPPSFEESTYNRSDRPRLRNMTLTTIAPTGTISIISDCSSGIEPLFAIAYHRNVMDNDKLAEFNPYFEKIARERGFGTEAVMEQIAEKGHLKDVEGIPDDVKEVFVTAHDINPEWHIKMQAAFQKYTDNAVSKTINFPEYATVEEVRESYRLAYKLGCKGLTIYRDNSRSEQVLNVSTTKPEETEEAQETIAPRQRPTVVKGTTSKVSTGCGNLYVTINEDADEQPFEMFMQMGKAGGCAMSQLEAIGRLVSLALRSGVDVKSIINQIRGIRCPSPTWAEGGKILSCSDAIARVIEQRIADQTLRTQAKAPTEPAIKEKVAVKVPSKVSNMVGICPDCGDGLQHVEGCMVCRGCGFSKCG
jgi:ribonucleoside-diphosphate reductase alpha chain